MVKKLLAGTFIVFILGTSSTTLSFANNPLNTNQRIESRMDLTRPEVRISPRAGLRPVEARPVESRPEPDPKMRSRIGNSNYFFEILEMEKNVVTTDKNILLSFRATEGTDVRIEVYHNASTREKEENYVLSYDPIEIKVGAFQKGWASVDLKTGLNKIVVVVSYRREPEDSLERLVNVMEVHEVKQLMQDVVNKSTLGVGKR